MLARSDAEVAECFAFHMWVFRAESLHSVFPRGSEHTVSAQVDLDVAMSLLVHGEVAVCRLQHKGI